MRPRPRAVIAALALLAGAALAACAPRVADGAGRDGPAVPARIADDALVMPDGARLPLRVWRPEGAPRAALVALHGFNDYSRFFDDPGRFLAVHGVVSYAYDQRGFGAAPHPGIWAGRERLAADLRIALDLVGRAHPDLPLYVLGASMGGAVAIDALAGHPAARQVKGAVLSGPAVWARETMPWYQRAALWLGAHLVPWMKLTGEGLDIVPSDNIAMLRELGRDPLVIKRTRIDAMWGVVNLMDRALAAAPAFRVPTLVLYGEHDQIIPPEPVARLLERLPEESRTRFALYRDGYHMLLRDLQGETVWVDVARWIEDRDAPLPSQADQRPRERLRALTGGDG